MILRGLERLAGSALILLLGAFALIFVAIVYQGIAALIPPPLVVLSLDDGEAVSGLLLRETDTNLELLLEIRAAKPEWRSINRQRIIASERPSQACILNASDGRMRLQTHCVGSTSEWSISYPNSGGTAALARWWQAAKDFLIAPVRPDGQGGIGSALVSTMVLVLLMTLLVVPFGIGVALYLAEYAGDTGLTRAIRLTVANLAAVPPVVFGLFGLGLLVHVFGSQIDQWLFSERLPSPTFATGGLLWASVVLALLTLPVVVVACEQGFRRVPHRLREASLALGATHTETVLRVLLPAARPALLTALILAVARASAEVAPLLLVGAVRYAAQLPVSSEPPFVHLERPFMHLGYRVLDLATSSAGGHYALQQAFACALVLLLLVLGLNGTAIIARLRLRARYRDLG
ncbi:MAG: ABC transporter permease subunit [Xanthomonadales bacterium]|nr:ABC transporter permease subunit [Xanthomonadales bacterium]